MPAGRRHKRILGVPLWWWAGFPTVLIRRSSRSRYTRHRAAWCEMRDACFLTKGLPISLIAVMLALISGLLQAKAQSLGEGVRL